MLKRIISLSTLIFALFSGQVLAVYFPAGIDWTNESRQHFVLSMYLNMLGRAPEAAELRTMSQVLSRNDNSQTRLELFKQFLGSQEYRQQFPDTSERWRVYRAPDLNYNRGRNNWRYQAALQQPEGFQPWELSGTSTLPVAQAMAAYYNAYCYAGIPCVQQAEAANRRADPVIANQPAGTVHACADESAQRARFAWISFNGTTYPRGIDANTLCMQDHYYVASGTLMQRYQCQRGYTNCQRDQNRDIQGARTGRDDDNNPALFFSDGSRLVLTNYDELYETTRQSGQTSRQPEVPTAANQHACADPTQIARYYQWNSPNGTTESAGVGRNIVCMQDHYYVIEGMTLKHHDCARGFTNCRANPVKDVVAQRRTRVDGKTALQFTNGTTLSLLDKTPPSSSTRNIDGNRRATPGPAVTSQPTRRLAGQHECGVATLRLSQFRWLKSDGSTLWPDGVEGTVVCMDNAYYEIDGFVLRHHQCSGDFQSCRMSRGKDLIALRESTNDRGLRTLTFANGEQLSLISR